MSAAFGLMSKLGLELAGSEVSLLLCRGKPGYNQVISCSLARLRIVVII